MCLVGAVGRGQIFQLIHDATGLGFNPAVMQSRNVGFGCPFSDRSAASFHTAFGHSQVSFTIKQESTSTIPEEVQEFVNLTITEHMGKAYSEWKLKQDKEPVSEIDKKYQKLLETLSPEQEEVITEYCNAIFSSGADTEEFFYRLGLKDGLNLKNTVKSVLEMIS